MKRFTALLYLLLTSTLFSMGQITTDYPCYAVAKNSGNSNVLYGYSPDEASWFSISSTQTNNIAALAADNAEKILYAFESNNEAEGEFGIIDAATRDFNKIGSPGTASGDYGEIMLNNVTGLTFDETNRIMYAVHRVSGNINQTNDLLFQIDVSTGKFVPGAMLNSSGYPADYALIEEVVDTDSDVLVYNVTDIAINPINGDLYAVYAQDNADSVLGVINAADGGVEHSIFELNKDNVESLSFALNGNLYATTANIGGNNNSFLNIDYNNLSTRILTNISNTDFDFESLECFHKTVDFGICNGEEVVLKSAVKSDLYQSLSIKDNVTTENYVEENSTVTLVAKEVITFENMFIPSNSNLVMEIRPCGF